MMETQLQDDHLNLVLPNDQGTLQVFPGVHPAQKTATTLYYQGSDLLGIDQVADAAVVTRSLVILPLADTEPAYISGMLSALATKAGLKFADPKLTVPKNQQKPAQAYIAALLPVLTLLGAAFAPKAKKKPAKAQHRWQKAVAAVAFTTDFAGTQATIYWQKRNEMRLVAGAHMLPEPKLNADGSLGFSARFAQQLRQEHQAAFNQDFVTTADIILKSTNEVGLFLYFGNTNSWLQFKDANGKTLDDWTIVK
ncbi:hypothetical protein ACFQ5J_11715 [Lacticaseibacillus baoqingensis]|uniref:Uncharacterized protein n=2 Tax=Lacticaseibacillus baoqingensis TaxID=2486013 RepID=A0ABW4E880_9LACO